MSAPPLVTNFRTAAHCASDIAARSGLSVSDVQGVLAVLELEGRAKENERGWLTRGQ